MNSRSGVVRPAHQIEISTEIMQSAVRLKKVRTDSDGVAVFINIGRGSARPVTRRIGKRTALIKDIMLRPVRFRISIRRINNAQMENVIWIINTMYGSAPDFKVKYPTGSIKRRKPPTQI